MKRQYFRKRSITNTSVPTYPPEISPEFVAREILACKRNFFYFLKYCFVTLGGRDVSMRDILYPAQQNLINSILESHYCIVLKSRQIGISTILQCFSVWLVLFNPSYQVGVISRKAPEATDFNRKIMKIIQKVPLWLTGHKKINDRFKKFTEQTFILENDSSVVCEAVPRSDPENVLRGKTSHFLIIDEAAFIPKADKAYAAVAPTCFKGHEEMKSENMHYGIAIVSTPNGTAGTGRWFYEMWIQSLRDETLYTPSKIHYSQAPFATDEWVSRLRKLMTKSEWDQEMELVFVTPEDSLIESDILQCLKEDVLQQYTQEKLFFSLNETTFTANYKKWYNHPTELLSDATFMGVIVGLDVASAFGGTSNTAVEVVAVYKEITQQVKLVQIGEILAKIPLSCLQELLYNLIMKEFEVIPNRMLVFENNSYAQSLAEKLPSVLPLEHLFWQPSQHLPGVSTNSKTKTLMLESLYWYLSSKQLKIKSEVVFNELSSIKKVSGKVPDSCMSLAFICYVINNFPDTIIYWSSSREKNDIQNVSEFLSIINNYQQRKALFTSPFEKKREEEERIKRIIEGENPDLIDNPSKYILDMLK